jgi:hypothetical protein
VARAYCSALTLVVFAISASNAGAEESAAVGRANRMAYEASMKCFVANGHARGLRTRAGDPAKAAMYERKAHDAFDMAHLAGQALGLSEDEVNADIKAVQDETLPRMVGNESYFHDAVAACKAADLM